MSADKLTEERLIAAPPEIVAKAIASPHGLATWLCDEARAEKRAEGRIMLEWNDGRLVIGRWSAYDQPQRLAWQLLDEKGANPFEAAFELTPEAGGTRLVATATGFPAESGAPQARLWRNALDDLQTFAEAGRNGRLQRRPMLGISIDVVTDDLVKKEALHVDHGHLITGIVADSGAEKAGLQKGDVIVAIDEHVLTDWGSIGAALDGRAAGDTVTAHVYRGEREMPISVTLQGRPVPQSPEGAKAIGEALSKATADWIERMEEALGGVTDEHASRRPAEGEWSVKEVLAHLSMSERFGHDWLTRLATDGRPATWPEDFGGFWQSTIAALPIRDLKSRYYADLKDSEAISLAALDRDPTPWVERSIAESISYSGEHIEEHLGQIRATLGRDEPAE